MGGEDPPGIGEIPPQSVTLTAGRTPQWIRVGITSEGTRPASTSQVRYSAAE